MLPEALPGGGVPSSSTAAGRLVQLGTLLGSWAALCSVAGQSVVGIGPWSLSSLRRVFWAGGGWGALLRGWVLPGALAGGRMLS